MLLSIISLNYKKADLTVLSMQSLYEQYQEQFNDDEYEYIVVDNNSEDGSADFLAKEVKKFKNFQFVQNTQNTGFGSGNNLGAKHAKGKYLLFLNNDTKVKDTSIIKMLEYLEQHNDIAAAGAKLVDSKGNLQQSAGKSPLLLQVILFLGGLERLARISNTKKISEVDWVEGSCLLVRNSAFDEVGGFDNKIFMYVEDMELCYRIKQLHHKIIYYPFTTIEHTGQGSSNRSFAIINIYQNILYLFKKHKPHSQYIIVKFMLRTKARVLFWLGKLYNREYLVKTYGKALEVTR